MVLTINNLMCPFEYGPAIKWAYFRVKSAEFESYILQVSIRRYDFSYVYKVAVAASLTSIILCSLQSAAKAIVFRHKYKTNVGKN